MLEASDFDSRALTDTVPTPAARAGLLDRSSLVMLMRLRRAKLQPRLTQTANRWRTRLGLVATSTAAAIPADTAPATDDSPTVIPSEARDVHLGDVEKAVVRALAASYGDRLSIVYVANTRMQTEAAPDPQETRLAAASSALGVRFASTRLPMVERLREGIITRGFPTTTPGSGHLNARGHEMMGRIIWSMIQDRDSVARR